MNTNRSGTRTLTLTVAKLRSMLHAAVEHGQALPTTVDPLGDAAKRRAYIKQAIQDMGR